MTDDTILSHAEALAEIKRLKRTNIDLAALLREQGCQMLAIRERIALLEATLAVRHGTWASGVLVPPDDDQPATYTHDVPPNAPR